MPQDGVPVLVNSVSLTEGYDDNREPLLCTS